MSTERTEIDKLGEFGLIDHLTENFETNNASTILSIGDDAAVIDHFGKQTVITTDLLIEGVHFDLMYTPLKHLGYKAVMVNLSDIYAMNATPTQITMSIAFSNRFSLEALEEFYEGVNIACEKYDVDLIGGDTSTSQKGFIISVTALGEVTPDKYIKRSTAESGDLICVSGDLGAAFLGLTLMEREKQIFVENPQIQPNLENEDYIVGRLLKPEATEPTATPYYGGGFDYSALGATQYSGTDIAGSQGGELVAKVYGDNAANRMKTYYKNMNLIADGATFI